MPSSVGFCFFTSDPVGVVRHHRDNLRPRGVFVAIDFDIGGARAEPPVAILEDTRRWVEKAFAAAGAWPRIGATLGLLLEEAGFTRVTTFGVQPYLSPRDRTGPALLAGVVRSLAPVIIAHGIATAEQLELATLEQRIAEALRQANAVLLPPTVVGAWGYAPDAVQKSST